MLSSRKTIAALIVALLLVSSVFAAEQAKESVDPAWKVRFDEICGVVAAAGDLSIPELQEYIRLSNSLITEIRGLDIPDKKVYIFRLDKCIKFFKYTIDLKERDKASDGK